MTNSSQQCISIYAIYVLTFFYQPENKFSKGKCKLHDMGVYFEMGFPGFRR